MTENEKEGIRIFKSMSIQEIDEWMKKAESNDHVTESQLEFEVIDAYSVEEYAEANNLVPLDNLVAKSRIDVAELLKRGYVEASQFHHDLENGLIPPHH